MKKIYVFLTFILLTTGIQNTIYAQFDPVKGCIVDNGECVPNTLLTALPFLRIAPDARGGAMGDVGIALAPDVNAMHYNASNLAFTKRTTALGMTYTPWLRGLNLNDVYLLYLSGYFKLDEVQTVGAALRYFSLGAINFTSVDGVSIGDGNPREFEFLVTYARKLGDNFSAALSAKYLYSNLASGFTVNSIEINSATAFAADVSLTYKDKRELGGYKSELTYGLAISNLGSKVSYRTDNKVKDFLPSNLGLGVGVKMDIDNYNTLNFGLDLNKALVPTPISQTILDEDGKEVTNPESVKDNDDIADYRQKALFSGILGSFSDAQGGFSEELKEFALSFGAEYWYDKQFALRAGYYYENPQKGDRQYFTIGLGVQYNIFGINLAYLVPTNNRRNPLDNTLRFSLIFDFEGYQDKY